MLRVTSRETTLCHTGGYQRKVEVRYIPSTLSAIDHTTAASGSVTDTKLVVVTVTSPQNEKFYFTSVVCNL